MFNFILLMGSQGGEGGGLLGLLPFLAIIVIMYFLMIRPQMKKQKDRQKMARHRQSPSSVFGCWEHSRAKLRVD